MQKFHNFTFSLLASAGWQTQVTNALFKQERKNYKSLLWCIYWQWQWVVDGSRWIGPRTVGSTQLYKWFLEASLKANRYIFVKIRKFDDGKKCGISLLLFFWQSFPTSQYCQPRMTFWHLISFYCYFLWRSRENPVDKKLHTGTTLLQPLKQQKVRWIGFISIMGKI